MTTIYNRARSESYDTFWDFRAQENVILASPEYMEASTARRLIPQTPRAERLFIQYHKFNKYTPYRAMQEVNRIIFGA